MGMLHKAVVMDVLNAALAAGDPYRAVKEALADTDLTGYSRIYVAGAGKAGAAMARAVEDNLGERIAAGLVVVKEGHRNTGGNPLRHIELVEAAHPVPDIRGVDAASRVLALADTAAFAGEHSLLLCLISGGGSALLSSPAEGVTIEDLQATTTLLLRAGANINELNAVRKHLSRIAGGQLARRASPTGVLSLILSDVIGSPLDVIASGPTAPDPTTFADALAALDQYRLTEQVPQGVLVRLRRGAAGEVADTPKPTDPLFERVSNRVISSNEIAVEAAARRAVELGLNTMILSTSMEGEAKEAGTVIAGIAREVVAYGRPVPRPACVLFGGETTVTVRGNGRGGRNTELALGAALALDGLGRDVVVASFATDGGDGNCPAAGAMADGDTIARARSLGLNARASLASNDSFAFWERLGDAIITGPTGTNVNDLMAAFIF
jgi:hydroxypyruvate reductase